jgi:hypothetical protein
MEPDMLLALGQLLTTPTSPLAPLAQPGTSKFQQTWPAVLVETGESAQVLYVSCKVGCMMHMCACKSPFPGDSGAQQHMRLV